MRVCAKGVIKLRLGMKFALGPLMFVVLSARTHTFTGLGVLTKLHPSLTLSHLHPHRFCLNCGVPLCSQKIWPILFLVRFVPCSRLVTSAFRTLSTQRWLQTPCNKFPNFYKSDLFVFAKLNTDMLSHKFWISRRIFCLYYAAPSSVGT